MVVAGVYAISAIKNKIARSPRRRPGATVLLTLISTLNTVSITALRWEKPSSTAVPNLDSPV